MISNRTVATAVFASSVAAYTGMVSMYPFFFHYSFLLQFPPAIHRLFTSFLLTGPGLGVLFETYFVYSYLSQIEKSNPKFSRKEDLLWYLMFVGGVIIVGLPCSRIPSVYISLPPFPISDRGTITSKPQHICPHSVMLLQL